MKIRRNQPSNTSSERPLSRYSERHSNLKREAQRAEIEAHVDTDIAFHRAIVVASQNPILVDLFDGFTPRCRQAMIDLLRLRDEFGSDVDHHAHISILDAIADRDGQKASTLARTHLLTLKME